MDDASLDRDAVLQALLPPTKPKRTKIGPLLCRAGKVEQLRRERLLRLHEQRVDRVRSTVDTSSPRTRNMSHLRSRAKKKHEGYLRQLKIGHENKLLVKRMTSIMHRANQFAGTTADLERRQHANERLRRREMERIERENAKLVRRLERTEPACKASELRKDWAKNKKRIESIKATRRSSGSPRNARCRLPVLSKVLPLPVAQYTNEGGLQSVGEATFTVTMVLDQRKRLLEIRVQSMQAPGVEPARASPFAARTHKLIAPFSLVLELANNETDNMFHRVSRLLWLRNDQLMLTASSPCNNGDVLRRLNTGWTSGGSTVGHCEAHQVVSLDQLGLDNASEKEDEAEDLADGDSDIFEASTYDDSLTAEDLGRQATRFQAHFRGYLARKEQKEKEEAARVLQTQVRTIAERRAQREKARAERELLAKQRLENDNAVVLQSKYRSFRAQKSYRLAQEAGASLGRSMSMAYAPGPPGKLKPVISEVSTGGRRKSTMMNASFRRRPSAVISQSDAAAAILQKRFRGHMARKEILERLVVFGSNYYRMALQSVGPRQYILAIYAHGEEHRLQQLVFRPRGDQWRRRETELMEALCSRLIRLRDGDLPNLGPFYIKYCGTETNSKGIKLKLRCAARSAKNKRAMLARVFSCDMMLVVQLHDVQTGSSTWLEIGSSEDLKDFFGRWQVANLAAQRTMVQLIHMVELKKLTAASQGSINSKFG